MSDTAGLSLVEVTAPAEVSEEASLPPPQAESVNVAVPTSAAIRRRVIAPVSQESRQIERESERSQHSGLSGSLDVGGVLVVCHRKLVVPIGVGEHVVQQRTVRLRHIGAAFIAGVQPIGRV